MRSPISGRKGGKNFGTGGQTPSRSKGLRGKTFGGKVKRNPASKNPGKNTKGLTKTRAKGYQEIQQDAQRDATAIPAPAVANQADMALQKLIKPQPSFGKR